MGKRRSDTVAKREEQVAGVRKGFRRHHNTDGRAQIKAGKTAVQVRAIAKRLGIPFKTGSQTSIRERGTDNG